MTEIPETAKERRSYQYVADQLYRECAGLKAENTELRAENKALRRVLKDCFADWLTLVEQDLNDDNEDVKRIYNAGKAVLARAKKGEHL